MSQDVGRLIGAYRIVETIGRGASGTVHKAAAPDGSVVAIKVLCSSATKEAFARFRREAAIQSSLGEAEGFVPILASEEQPWPFLVMPYYPGGTLRERLRRGPLPWREAVELGVRLATALGRAHARGIVHRDLKPENVIFTSDGRPLVADLGIARHFRQAGEPRYSATQFGEVLGTVGFMPPEQMRDARNVGPPADVFALGAILSECLTGAPAFAGGSTLEVIDKVNAGTGVPLRDLRPDVPAWLEGVVDRALATSPWERIPDGRALARALESAGRETESGPPRVRGVAIVAIVLVTVAVPLAIIAWPKETDVPARETPSPSRKATPSSTGAASAIERAEARLRAKDADGALAELEKVLKTSPGSARAWLGVAEARLMLHEYEAASAAVDRCLELEPDSPRALYVRASCLVKSRRDLQGAIAYSSRALKLDPRLAIAHVPRAAAELFLGDVPGALASADQGLAVDPKEPQLWMIRGMAHMRAGALEDAIADMSSAIALAPDDPVYLLNRADVSSFRGDHAAAIEDLTRALALGPRAQAIVADVYRTRAQAFFAQQDFGRAQSDCSSVLEIDPDDDLCSFLRGACRRHGGDHSGAISDLTRALERNPKRVAALLERGLAEQALGDRDRALVDFTRAADLKDLDPDAAARARGLRDELRDRR